MAQSYVPKFYKVLYSSFGFVFDEVERENPGFYNLNRAKQWELLKAKVESLMASEPAPVLPMMETIPEPEENEPEENEPEDNE